MSPIHQPGREEIRALLAFRETIEPRLDRFLDGAARTPFKWGVHDCALLLADWLVALGRDDPAFDLRGTYATEEQCRAVLARHGGLLPLVTLCAERAELRAIDAPARGSVAVIGAALRRDRQWGAIWDGSKWQVRWGDGLVGFRARPLMVWSVT